MEKKISKRRMQVKKRDPETVEPSELTKRLSKVFGLEGNGSLRYKENKDSSCGTLFLRWSGSYDIQEVGSIISSSGYAIVGPDYSPVNPKTFLENVASLYEGTKERAKKMVAEVVSELRLRRDISDLVRRKKSKITNGTGTGDTPI